MTMKKSKGPKTTHLKDRMTNSNEEEEEPMTARLVMDEEAEELATPKSKMDSNIVNNTPREIGSSHFVRHKSP
jgi:guanylate kinase